MDLMERYFQAVRFWLPKENQDDLLAELAEDLRCQQEEAEERLGRPLDEGETADLLRRTGSPLSVAGKYLPMRPLLDPALTMLFRFVVKVVLLWILMPIFLLAAVPAALLSSHPLGSMAGALQSFLYSAVFALGCITIMFVVASGALTGAPWALPRQWTAWDPLKLPPLRKRGDAKPIPRASSIFEAVFGLLFAAWWMESAVRLPLIFSQQFGPMLASTSLWTDFRAQWYLPVLVLTLANVLVACACLAKPHLVRFRLAYGVISGTWLGCICLLTLVGHKAELLANIHIFQSLGHSPSHEAALQMLANETVGFSLAVVGFSSLLAALVQGVKLLWSARSKP